MLCSAVSAQALPYTLALPFAGLVSTTAFAVQPRLTTSVLNAPLQPSLLPTRHLTSAESRVLGPLQSDPPTLDVKDMAHLSQAPSDSGLAGTWEGMDVEAGGATDGSRAPTPPVSSYDGGWGAAVAAAGALPRATHLLPAWVPSDLPPLAPRPQGASVPATVRPQRLLRSVSVKEEPLASPAPGPSRALSPLPAPGGPLGTESAPSVLLQEALLLHSALAGPAAAAATGATAAVAVAAAAAMGTPLIGFETPHASVARLGITRVHALLSPIRTFGPRGTGRAKRQMLNLGDENRPVAKVGRSCGLQKNAH